MVERISTAMLQQQSLNHMNSRMADINKLNAQISSGKKARTFDDLDGNVNRVVSYQGKLNKIDNYISNNKVAITRLNTASTSVTAIQKTAEDFRSMLVQWKSDGNETGNSFVQQAKGYLDLIAGQLNVTVEGRYIFGGTKTNEKPVPQPIPEPTTYGVADDNYYAGDGNDITIRASDSYVITAGVRADDPAFQQLITAIKTAINADGSNDSSMFNKALDLTTKAVENLTTVTAKINSGILNLESINEQHSSIQTYLKNSLGDEVDTDITEATTQLSVDQTVLQATYSAFARISSLKLTDYLN